LGRNALYKALRVMPADFVISLMPPIHKDPFDRLLIAQAMVEGITLLTDDATVAQYQGLVRMA
jgi:PIN domain nuclease of toxin-antitoxin system